MVWVSLLSVLGLTVLAATRIAVIAIALKDVPAGERANVLVGLSECFRWWQPKRP